LLDRAAAQYPKARTYKDFRGMHKPEIWKKGIVPPCKTGTPTGGREPRTGWKLA